MTAAHADEVQQLIDELGIEELAKLGAEAIRCARFWKNRNQIAIHDGCARVLIHLAHDVNARTTQVVLKDVAIAGEPIGDWEVVVRRIKDPKQ